jgi:hypothetical protein
LPVLAQIVEKRNMRLRIVLLDQEKRARGDIQKVSLRLEKLAVPSSVHPPRQALLSAGDSDGILPFARSVSPSGKTCATWRGGMTMLRVKAMIAACRVISRYPR